jgi:hypothetical protein
VTSPDQRNSIAHLDFSIGCVVKGCHVPASYFIEWHQVGACTHPALNSAGNIERWLCGEHAALAAKDAQRRSERPWWWSWFHPDPPICVTCGRKVQHAGDILQIVRSLRG